MLPLPAFGLHTPRTLDEALRLLGELGPDARVIAGGTDILPAMKRGVMAPRVLVSLQGIAELRGVVVTPESVVIGAMTVLESVARDAVVSTEMQALAEACLSVGSPLHRAMGTLGGNVCLDARCRYINQTEFWRSALGYCIKKDGTKCHVVPAGRRCVAAASNDTAAALIALGATLELRSQRGTRWLPIAGYYTADGVYNQTRTSDEVLTAVRLPRVAGRRSAYEKLRIREAIDFPLVSVAARADVSGGRVNGLEVVVSALAARPRVLRAASELAPGGVLDTALVTTLARAAERECRPLPNIDGDETWRHAMVPVLVRRALSRVMGETARG